MRHANPTPGCQAGSDGPPWRQAFPVTLIALTPSRLDTGNGRPTGTLGKELSGARCPAPRGGYPPQRVMGDGSRGAVPPQPDKQLRSRPLRLLPMRVTDPPLPTQPSANRPVLSPACIPSSTVVTVRQAIRSVRTMAEVPGYFFVIDGPYVRRLCCHEGGDRPAPRTMRKELAGQILAASRPTGGTLRSYGRSITARSWA